jgi:hypothetical protein
VGAGPRRSPPARRLQVARASALLHVPEWAEPPGPDAPVRRRPLCDVVPGLPGGTVIRPPAVGRALRRQPRQAVVVSDTVLAHADADGDVHCIPWDAVEAVAPVDGSGGGPGGVVVVGRNLCTVVVHPQEYGRRNAGRVVAALRAHVPAERWLQRPQAEPPGGVPAPVR